MNGWICVYLLERIVYEEGYFANINIYIYI